MSADTVSEADDRGARGRGSQRPRDIPGPGWWQIAARVKDAISNDNVSLISAGLALYALLAIFPALAAALSLYGIVASPETVAGQVRSLSGVLPQQASEILRGQLQNLAGSQSGALGIGAVGGLLVALWSARKGMAALMTATNIAYDTPEERSFLRQVAVSLAFTLAAVVAFLVFVAIVAAVPVVMQVVGAGEAIQWVTAVLRWVLLWVLMVLGLGVVYRYAPDRHSPRWRWVSPGAAIAATLWMLGSVLFAIYVRNFGSYGETYGALGGVVILLMWFYLSGFTIVLGAEVNAEMERQVSD